MASTVPSIERATKGVTSIPVLEFSQKTQTSSDRRQVDRGEVRQDL